jgi:hypothetical protein
MLVFNRRVKMLHKMMTAEDERREGVCEILAELAEDVRRVRLAIDKLILGTYRAESELPVGTLSKFWDAVRGTQDEIAGLIIPEEGR